MKDRSIGVVSIAGGVQFLFYLRTSKLERIEMKLPMDHGQWTT